MDESSSGFTMLILIERIGVSNFSTVVLPAHADGHNLLFNVFLTIPFLELTGASEHAMQPPLLFHVFLFYPSEPPNAMQHACVQCGRMVSLVLSDRLSCLRLFMIISAFIVSSRCISVGVQCGPAG